MIWAGFSLHTETNAIVIDGNLNAARYQNEILRPVAIPHIGQNMQRHDIHTGQCTATHS
jgi:hypothetical protein